jgi:uncharacterized membrane protein HdeD (DUF308 family)
MRTKHKRLLIIDGFVNLVLGVLLLLYPTGIASYLGVPQTESSFYPTILGGVIFGIGIALMLEAFGAQASIRGLGLAGAIAINFCGAGVLTVWLTTTPLNIPTRGYIVLWGIAGVVLVIGAVELLTGSWKYSIFDRSKE